ncbi:phospholipase A2-like [Brienomyrus brachyistius]|uniref:phospholipase A2-like n=1 Tax=Brienomyrus brachyistius TaxID=42636 RepID=UPI0020B286FE|nr:phospholipase A2-like [Brienomyrus brachyistius]
MVSLSWGFVQIAKMKTLQTLLMLASSLSIVMMDPDYKSLSGLREMIICKIPSSWPLLDYGDYGCYCGKGGAGTPVDDLDRCCQTHDHCYDQAMKLEACWPVLENPYTLPYSYNCDKANKTITCEESNTVCEMFVCECDRHAAICFAGAGYNKEHHNMNQELCK